MKIHHRLNLEVDLVRPLLSAYELEVRAATWKCEGGQIIVDDVSEDDPNWPRIAALLSEYHQAWVKDARNASFVARYRSTGDPLADTVEAEFSEVEQRTAPFLAIGADDLGNPLPDDLLEFYRTTYTYKCRKCRSSPEQINSLFLAGEPTWKGSLGIFQLSGAADEFLVKREMYDEIFRPFGVGMREVRAYKSKAPLRTVVQLEIVARADVDVNGLTYQVCEMCGAKRYKHSERDFAPLPMTDPGSMFKSSQDFSPLCSLTYISQELFQAIETSGFTGAGFLPCSSRQPK